VLEDEWGSQAAVDPRPALERFTITSMGRLFLGVEPATDDHATIQALYARPGPLYWMGGLDGPRGAELRRAAEQMAEMVRRRARIPPDQPDGSFEPTGSLLSEIVHEHDEAVDDPNVVLNLVFLLANASRDVTGLMHWVVKMLGDHPSWIACVRAENGSGDLSRRIVTETLRLAQSEYLSRRAVDSFELDGFVVPKGWYVRVCVNEAHRDASVFPDPDTFDPDRFRARRYSRDEYAPFGMLNHACLGASATLRVAATFVEELSRVYDLEVVRDGPPFNDGFHWRPSERHRVRLIPPAMV
jgi:cytochrome P450